jgi:hypothetical protein
MDLAQLIEIDILRGPSLRIASIFLEADKMTTSENRHILGDR